MPLRRCFGIGGIGVLNFALNYMGISEALTPCGPMCWRGLFALRALF